MYELTVEDVFPCLTTDGQLFLFMVATLYVNCIQGMLTETSEDVVKNVIMIFALTLYNIYNHDHA